MGIGYQALSAFDEIFERNQLKDCKSVIEMGSQEIYKPFQWRAKFLLNKYNKSINDDFITTKKFYSSFGFNEYACIDATGDNNSLIFDLNLIIKDHYNYNNKFDLVTNFGTSEHLINQKNMFENMHNLTKKNGYILHILPFEGDINHCYFNYHPNFFYDLALYNNYKIVNFWYYTERATKIFKTYSGYNFFKGLKYNNELMFFLDDLANKNKFMCSPLKNGSSLGVMFKKIEDKGFVVPFDKQSGMIKTKLKEYNKGAEKLDDNLNVNLSINHQEQVNEILGSSYWKTIIKNFILSGDYRKKFIAKFLYKVFRYKTKHLSKHSIFMN